VVLEAPAYAGGHLDWHSFNLRPGAWLGDSASGPAPVVETLNLIPTPVKYRGMPASRWWEFEDGRINFGALPAGQEDLARLLLIEFALIYGNDWLVVPVPLAAGAVGRITEFRVYDTFGVSHVITPYRETDRLLSRGAFRLFDLTGQTPDDPSFFLAPALGQSLHSEAMEEVLFLRDEMANLAWAVERLVEGTGGEPMQRFEQYRQALQQVAAAAEAPLSSAPLRYRLGTTVPDYWFPLIPQRLASSQQMRLVRGTVAGPGEGRPLGRILQPEAPLAMQEEEVPRAGARVTRAFQYARWVDGSAHLWVGRRKGAGRGEGSSGLRFDMAENID